MTQTKRPNRLEAGLQDSTNWLHQQIIGRLETMKTEIVEEVTEKLKLPNRLTDRVLRKVLVSNVSWAWVLLYTLFCVMAGAAIQAAVW